MAIPAAPPSSSRRGRLGQVRGQDQGRRSEGDEAHQSPARHGRRLRHAPRHSRRPGDDGHHRLCRGDAVQGRLVRQRHHARHPAQKVQDKVREMVKKLGDRLWQEGYKGVFCCDFLVDTDDQRSLSRRTQPAHQRRLAADQSHHHHLRRVPAVPVPPAGVPRRRLGGRSRAGAGALDRLCAVVPADPQADRGQGGADHQGAALAASGA